MDTDNLREVLWFLLSHASYTLPYHSYGFQGQSVAGKPSTCTTIATNEASLASGERTIQACQIVITADRYRRDPPRASAAERTKCYVAFFLRRPTNRYVSSTTTTARYRYQESGGSMYMSKRKEGMSLAYQKVYDCATSVIRGVCGVQMMKRVFARAAVMAC